MASRTRPRACSPARRSRRLAARLPRQASAAPLQSCVPELRRPPFPTDGRSLRAKGTELTAVAVKRRSASCSVIPREPGDPRARPPGALNHSRGPRRCHACGYPQRLVPRTAGTSLQGLPTRSRHRLGLGGVRRTRTNSSKLGATGRNGKRRRRSCARPRLATLDQIVEPRVPACPPKISNHTARSSALPPAAT